MVEDFGTRNRISAVEEISAQAIHHHPISWRAIFAGALVSLLAYAVLMSLGLAVGGGTVQGALQTDGNVGALGVGAGIWMVLSVLASLFAGSYVAGRVAGMIPIRVGRYQGAVVAGLFFALMFSQVGAMVGSIGSGLGQTLGAIGARIPDVAQSPIGQDVIDDAIGDLNLKSPPDVVAKGVARRLLRGNDDAALSYLSRQANISREEAQARLDSFKADFRRTANDAGVVAAKTVRVAGWTIFGALVLGTLAAMVGGGVGAQLNLRSPLSGSDRRALGEQRAA